MNPATMDKLLDVIQSMQTQLNLQMQLNENHQRIVSLLTEQVKSQELRLRALEGNPS